MQILLIGKTVEGYDCYNEFKSSSNVLKYFVYSFELFSSKEIIPYSEQLPHTDSREVLNMKLLWLKSARLEDWL